MSKNEFKLDNNPKSEKYNPLNNPPARSLGDGKDLFLQQGEFWSEITLLAGIPLNSIKVYEMPTPALRSWALLYLNSVEPK